MIKPVDTDAAVVMSRFGLGGAISGRAMRGAQIRDAIRAEIDAEYSPRAHDLPDTAAALVAIRDYYIARNADPTVRPYAIDQEIGRRETRARFEDALSAETGFSERMSLFWANHFAVNVAKGRQVRILAGVFEREAIRPYMYGRFADMLLAVARHPAMLYYLDNVRSIGPNSQAGRRDSRGLNENLAREMLELHTLGVNGGYTQSDVTAFARILSGWGVNTGKTPGFIFRKSAHEPGPHTVMGKTYSESGVAQAEAVIADLANHPATARHLAFKLARHFLSDAPEPEVIDTLAAAFASQDGGDLRALSLALIDAPQGRSTTRPKMRSPQEHLMAMVRATGLSLEGQTLLEWLSDMGQPQWQPPAPNGFSDLAGEWATPVGVSARLAVASQVAALAPDHDPRAVARTVLGPLLTGETLRAVEQAETQEQGLALLFLSPEYLRR